MRMYAIKDVKSGTFSPVMMGHNDAHMSRTLVESLGGSQATAAKFPEDFELYYVGEFNDENAQVTGELRFVCQLTLVFNPNGSVPNA